MIDKQAATKIVRETFEKPFDKGRFAYFAKNLLNKIDESKVLHLQGAYIPESFREFVKTYERLGTYTDPEGQKLDILIVYLQKETSLERARTAQRNFVARYLKERGEKEAGLVAFVSPEPEDWRFSFVKMEYRLEETPQGKVKAKEELTPARRLSFLVGENESSHTAQKQLFPILEDDKRNPTLSELEKAFSVEVVTREFFGKYRELFLDVKDALDKLVEKDEVIRKDFTAKKVSTVDFSKKLLGQIVFLYFLQKKGWFGVARDADWGAGSKQFLRELFQEKHGTYRNFFNDVLEPLFYEALRSDRSHDDDYYGQFKCKIPFLNGGLFDPINNYDWVHTDIILPNGIFSNSEKTKEGDTGTGILDVFDRYNFTVWEDEPLEKEVAIDPEMLGKVFENLLEVKDRKSKGTYYTPREIVHYMCQESLINYLDTAVNTGEAPLRQAGTPQGKLLGERWSAQMALSTPAYQPVVPRQDIETLVRKGELAIEHDSRVESHGKETERYPYKLDESIRQNAKLIDTKLENIRVCDPAVGSGAFLVGMMHEIVKCRKVLSTYLGEEERRSIYDFKRHAIQSCLYGVDIDPGAVEIAKLRLWLSLVVDEEDIRQIKPLPNLDYKIVCGNSLLCVERNMFNNELFQKLEELKPLYFDETNAKKKLEYKEQINQLIRQITNNNADFDFEVYFSEVFHEKGGFDVVMANPPYGIVFETAQKSRCESLYSTFIRNNDIYVAFYERGIGLLSFLGQLSYISPNTFLNGDYFKALRKFLTRETVITEIRDYKEIPVFDDPTVFVCVLNCSKRRSITYPYQVVINIAKGSIDNLAQGTFVIEISSDAQFKASNPIIEKLSNRSKFTMLEDLFFVKDVGFNYWTKGKGKKRDGNSIGDRVFYSGGRCNRNDIPFLKGRDIARWLPKAPSNYLRHNYEDFLDEAIDTLRFSHEYLKLNPKIIYRQTSNTIIAAIDFSAHYVDKTVHLIVPKISWGKCPATLLVGLLNSRLFAYLYSYISQETEGRVFAQVKTTYIKKLPIPQLLNGNSIIVLVDQILAAKRANLAADVLSLEREIDQLVYQLYGLTPEEISVVEGSIRDKA